MLQVGYGVSQIDTPELLGGVGCIVEDAFIEDDGPERDPLGAPSASLQGQAKAIEWLLHIQSRTDGNQARGAQRNELPPNAQVESVVYIFVPGRQVDEALIEVQLLFINAGRGPPSRKLTRLLSS